MSIFDEDLEHCADEIDRASHSEERARNREIEARRAAAAQIPDGVAGDCDGCGEYFARLVGGKCGFCRDGRRRVVGVDGLVV